MPRQPKGPRLYLRKGRIDARSGAQLPDRYFIRDGRLEIGTGCGPEHMGEAERQLAAYIAEKWEAPAGESDPAKVLISDALSLYVKEKGPKLRSDPATLLGFVKKLEGWWEGKTISDVRRSSCNAYVDHRTSQPRHGFKDPTTAPRVSAQTARRELEFLSAAIGFWDDEHHLTRRPTVVLPEKSESNRDALTRKQAALLLWSTMGWDLTEACGPSLDGAPVFRWARPSTNARTNRRHLRRFVLMGLYTGTRSGPIKRLHWTESLHAPWADLDAGIIYRRGKGEKEIKTKAKPLVKIPRRLLAHMRRWKAADQAKGIDVALHYNGEQMGSVRTGFASCVTGAGLPLGVTPHWLRHTAATWLMERNVDSWEASGYLGMTAATLEKHYGHHRPDHQSAARKAMG